MPTIKKARIKKDLELSDDVNYKVSLFQSNEKIDVNETIRMNYGYFRKNDPRLITDCMNNELIIYEPEYEGKYVNYFRYYFGVNENGEFTNQKISVLGYHNCGNKLLVVNGNFCSVDLLNNPNFNKHYKESYYDGIFYPIGHAKLKKDFVVPSKLKGIEIKMPFDMFDEEYMVNKPYTYNRTFGKKYTFGVEIETISGLLPAYLTSKIYFSSVFDGSLRHKDDNEAYGYEYVTNVLKGDLGLRNFKMLNNEITKRCLINYQCGNHFHIGDVNFTKENVVLMYYLYHKIQPEMFNLLPMSRRHNTYCKKLPNLQIDLNKIKPTNKDYKYFVNFYYHKILSFVNTVSADYKNYNKKTQHPKGFKCGYDHHSARYCWVNFVPALFNTRGNGSYTIEFRMASGGSSYIKNKNWLLICMGLVDIVENHKNEIYDNQNISLKDIMSISYGDKSRSIIDFMDSRFTLFSDQGSDLLNKKIEEADYQDNELDENLAMKSL